MSIYVMSDLHGCFHEFQQMLKQIEFSDYDDLYIIGDVCDRGPASMPLLQEIMRHRNMHVIMGNHDAWLLKYAAVMIDLKKDFRSHRITDDFLLWTHGNGGNTTMDQFMDLEFAECYDIRYYLEQLPYYTELTVHGERFLLMHAGYSQAYMKASTIPAEVPNEVLIWQHIGLDDNPYIDRIMIVGHTPTFLYGSQYTGKIAAGSGKRIYHIDCGCCFGAALGCLRLDDRQEFYIKSTMKKAGFLHFQ